MKKHEWNVIIDGNDEILITLKQEILLLIMTKT